MTPPGNANFDTSFVRHSRRKSKSHYCTHLMTATNEMIIIYNIIIVSAARVVWFSSNCDYQDIGRLSLPERVGVT